jgi:hypothetical protein
VIKPGAMVLAAAILVSAGAVALAGRDAEAPQPPSRQGSEVGTTRALLACPDTAERPGTKAQVLAVSPEADEAVGSEPGLITATTLDTKAPQVIEETDAPGHVLKVDVEGDSGAVPAIAAEGPMSAGLAAIQWSVEASASVSGLAASACLPGADSWWFAGISTEVGAMTRIILTNPTPAIAVADLRFYGPDGVVEAVGERGIALAPRSRQSIDLARFAPGLKALTVEVQATTGRVVAAVHTELTSGVTPGGTEWISPGAAPAPEVLVNAGPAGSDNQSLQITNPGDREALVKVQVVGDTGAFVPSGLDSVRVPPGTVVTKDLTDIVKKDAAAIALSSTVPVTGALVGTASKPADVAVTSSSPVLGDPAVIAMIPDADLTVAFSSNVGTDGQVTIEGFGGRGRSVSSVTLNLKGSTTKLWQPGKKTEAVYFVVTVTVDGSTQAVAQYSGKDGITALPVTSSTLTVTRPDVRPAR